MVNTWSWRDAYRIHSSSGGTSESCSNWARVRLLFFERNEVHSSALLKHENAFYRVKKRDPFEGLWLSLCELFGIKTSSIFGAFLGGNGAVCRSSHDFELYNLYAHRRDAGVKGTYSSPAKADAYRHWTKVGILSVSCGHPPSLHEAAANPSTVDVQSWRIYPSARPAAFTSQTNHPFNQAKLNSDSAASKSDFVT